MPEDSGVVVMVPGGGGSSSPIQSFPASNAPLDIGTTTQPWSVTPPATTQGGYVAPAPSGIPSGGLAMDEQLDGPVLALLTTAQQQQGGGDLNGAASSLERAQRIAPREPQVLYKLAEVRLAQGDAAQAEQFARRGLSYANGRPALQASLWNLIAQARERQGDAAGAAQAREQARVSL
jgi:predicted Zn-dependent protease